MSTLGRTDLKGARWSSAVRCVARAQHEALGSPRDEHAQAFLADAFVRGVSAADTWVDRQAKLSLEAGKTLVRELPIAWGPPGLDWEGHADAAILEDQLIIEAYHAKGGSFRRPKALQGAGYAHQKGEGWRAMLAVLDTTDVDEDAGFAVTYVPVELDGPNGLRPEVLSIMERVSAAVLAGAWNPEDRVADNPADNECRHCPFREVCWADWVPPIPAFAPELDDLAVRLVAKQAERAHLKAQVEALDEDVRGLRDELRPYMPHGRALLAGGVSIKRLETEPRRSFRFAAYEGAGHLVTPTMREFLSESKESGERWYVGRAA